MAVERGKLGILAYGILRAESNSSAKAPSPEPRTRAIHGRSLVLDRMNLAARSAWRNSRVGLAICFLADMNRRASREKCSNGFMPLRRDKPAATKRAIIAG